MNEATKIDELLERAARLPKIVHSRTWVDWVRDATAALKTMKEPNGVVLPATLTIVETAELSALRQELVMVRRTADGVVVYPGQHLFRVGPRPAGELTIRHAVVQPFRVTSPDGWSEVYAFAHCYSTREAAEAEVQTRRTHGKAVTE